MLHDRYPYVSPQNPCDNYIGNNYVINSLIIKGEGKVNIDCGDKKMFLALGDSAFSTGRIINVKFENLNVRRGVGDSFIFPSLLYHFF
jgi:hypothetical protein